MKRKASESGKEETVRVSPDEAVRMAIEMHRAGELERAETIYNKVLALLPEHPDALHFLGVLRHQQGESETAIELIRKALEVNPELPGAHNNLGNVLKESGHTEEAERAYRRCIELEPENPDAYQNLAIVLALQKRTEEAKAALSKTVELDPERPRALHLLSYAYEQMGQHDEAIAFMVQALQMRPESPNLRRSLGLQLCRLGKPEKAIRMYESWLSLHPDDAIARHMLASCRGEEVPERAGDEFIRRTFDDFASGFDQNLAALDYHAPDMVADALARHHEGQDGALDILDAGCGTGLCGPLVKPWARRLVGVDLSAGMIDKARARHCYDEFMVAELTAFLDEAFSAYDVIVSADTLCYFGDLDAVLAAARGALRDGGTLIFTVEHLQDGDDRPWKLHAHGRYSHAKPYVEDVLGRAGFELAELRHEILRKEVGKDVAGLVVTARAP